MSLTTELYTKIDYSQLKNKLIISNNVSYKCLKINVDLLEWGKRLLTVEIWFSVSNMLLSNFPFKLHHINLLFFQRNKHRYYHIKMCFEIASKSLVAFACNPSNLWHTNTESTTSFSVEHSEISRHLLQLVRYWWILG